MLPVSHPSKNVIWPSTLCQGESNRLKWMVLLDVRPPSVVTIRCMEGDLEVTERVEACRFQPGSSWNQNELVTVLTVIMRLWEMCDKCWPPAGDVATFERLHPAVHSKQTQPSHLAWPPPGLCIHQSRCVYIRDQRIIADSIQYTALCLSALVTSFFGSDADWYLNGI